MELIAERRRGRGPAEIKTCYQYGISPIQSLLYVEFPVHQLPIVDYFFLCLAFSVY